MTVSVLGSRLFYARRSGRGRLEKKKKTISVHKRRRLLGLTLLVSAFETAVCTHSLIQTFLQACLGPALQFPVNPSLAVKLDCHSGSGGLSSNMK